MIGSVSRPFARIRSRMPLPRFRFAERLAVHLFALVLLAAAPGKAQVTLPGVPPGPTPTPPETPAADPYDRETPHGCFFGFLHAAEKGNYKTAALYLQVPPALASAREEIARQLQVVFDHRLVTRDLDLVSKNPQGSNADSLGQGLERVAEVRGEGRLDVVLVRLERTEPPIWLISWETVRECRRLYDRLALPDLDRKLPRFMVETRLGALPLWQVAAFILLLPILFGVAWALVTVSFALLRFLRRRKSETPVGYWAHSARNPVTVLLTLILHRVAVEWMGMPALYRLFYNRILAVLLLGGLFWLLSRMVDALDRRVFARYIGPVDRQTTFSLLRRFLKIVAFVIVLLLGLAFFGVNLTTTLAGLGIGGLVLAFAAQKSLENLFGGIAVLVDRALSVGDLCRIGSAPQGEIEDITLWATRIRTQERTVLSIPNGTVASSQIENLSRRDKFWFHPVVGLVYDTKAGQLEKVLADLREMLAAEPRVQTRDARVQLARLGPSSLEIEVFAYVRAADRLGFDAIQEELLLKIIRIVEAAGTSLAFPSQTIYVRRDDRGAATTT
jgi:MscS family membrane protein